MNAPVRDLLADVLCRHSTLADWHEKADAVLADLEVAGVALEFVDETPSPEVRRLLEDPRERCPTCGSRPDTPDTHQDGCSRVDTCGQYGPPWIDPPWHPDDPMLDSRRSGETLDDYYARANVWMDALYLHRREAHEVGPPP